MFVILAHVSGALGLFFMGARFLTQHLKALNSHRFRLSVARWTNNRWMGFSWGVIAGAVMQSTVVLTLIVVGMLKSDLVSSRRAFPILLGGNVGVMLLLLVVMLDVKVMAFYALGIAYLLARIAARSRTSRYRDMATACFGLAMVLLGSILLKESVTPLASYPWFQQTMLWMGQSLLLPLLSGLVLTVVMQSGAPAVLSGICMAAAGLIGIPQVLMIFCGACLGGSLILYLLTLTVTGRARQVAMYQVLHNVVLNAIFVPLIFIEVYWEVPLIAAAVRASGIPLEQSLAMCLIFLECFNAGFRLAVLDIAVWLVERWWPATELEALAKPQFIRNDVLGDVETSLRLANLEQRRLFDMLSRHLDAVRSGTQPDELREATRELMGRIEEFLSDLAAHCSDGEADTYRSIITRQKLFIRLERQVLELCDALRGLPPKSQLATLSMVLVEGIDALLLVLIDTLASGEASAWPSTTQLMGDRAELLRNLRNLTLKEEPPLTGIERAKVVRLANVAEHVFLLVTRLAHEYRVASGVDAAFLDDSLLEEPDPVLPPLSDDRLAAR